MSVWLLVGFLGIASAEPPAGAFDPPATNGSVLQGSVAVAAWIWRHTITIGDGSRCPFHPSCSAYAVHAIRRDGPLGMVLAFDRLQRDGSAHEYALSASGHHRLDPVSDHPRAVDLLFGRTCRRQRAEGSVACF
ncbi:MAG TPA: hypothetical protein DFR83_18010 [Deltaproteobacteria bacterium]|nr:hypothetical protein [Deltaproteobacteria bacterium]